MNTEDLRLLSQLIDSMSLATEELEKAVEKQDIQKIKKLKEEILKFQKETAKIVG